MGFADEDPEEEYIAQETVTDTAYLDSISLSSLPNLDYNLIFVDGVTRYRIIGAINIRDVHVPLMIAHIIAGAMKTEDKKLRPYKKKELLIILFPFGAASNLIGQSILPGDFPVLENDVIKFSDLMSSEERDVVFSDTTLTLGRLPAPSGLIRRTLLTGNDLVASSKVIKTAKNRLAEIRRTLELALVLNIVGNAKDNELVIVDGPVAPLFKYIGLIDPNLRSIVRGLNDRKNAADAYDILKNIVGVVKKIVKIPGDLTSNLINNAGNVSNAHIYLWTKVIEDQEEGGEDSYIATYVLSAFFMLRKELLTENYPVFSPTSGLVRVDVPLPVIMNKDDWVNWVINNHEEVNDVGRDAIRQLVHNETYRAGLTKVLNIIYSLRYPVPSTTPYRRLVELYPIYEVEQWLKSNLLSKYELATIGLA